MRSDGIAASTLTTLCYSGDPVKTVRIWLLVLLAVLLPIRGAVAAAMLCPPTSSQSQEVGAVVAEADHHVMVHGEHGHADHQHAGHDTATPGTGGHHAEGVGKCNLCCNLCSMTPLLSTLPAALTPTDVSVVVFADPAALAPSFLGYGQERPPRSC